MVTLRAEYDAIVVNQLPQEVPRNWVRKLDAIEGDRLLRACRKRLESGTSHD
jgi:protein-L-isoaspartate O-methyltransferase